MENMTIPTTSRTESALQIPTQVTSFGMPARGCAFDSAWITVLGTDLAITQTTIRARSAAAAKGHVAFVANVSGSHAWSPPIC